MKGWRKWLPGLCCLLLVVGKAAAEGVWRVLEDAEGRKIEVEILEIDPTWLLARKKGGEPFKLEVLTLSEKTQGMLDELAYSEEWLTKLALSPGDGGALALWGGRERDRVEAMG